MKTISTPNITAASSFEGAYRVDFAEMIIDPTDSVNGTLRLCTLFKDWVGGQDDVNFALPQNSDFYGKTFTGAGQLLDLGEITDSIDVKQNSIRVSLSGVDQAIVSTITDTAFLGSPLTLYRGYYNEATGRLVDEPYTVWKGLVNDYSTVYGGSLGQENKVVISVTAKNLLVSILETKSGRYTSQESYERFNSSDKSMEFVNSLTTFNPRFGAD